MLNFLAKFRPRDKKNFKKQKIPVTGKPSNIKLRLEKLCRKSLPKTKNKIHKWKRINSLQINSNTFYVYSAPKKK